MISEEEWKERYDEAYATQKEGNYQYAEMQWTLLVADTEEFGSFDIRLAKTLERLSECLAFQGKIDEASEFGYQALEIFEYVQGHMHPDLGNVVSNLAMTNKVKKNLVEAENLYKRALAIKSNSLGGSHPEVLNVLTEFADCLQKMGRIEEAEQLKKSRDNAGKAPLTGTRPIPAPKKGRAGRFAPPPSTAKPPSNAPFFVQGERAEPTQSLSDLPAARDPAKPSKPQPQDSASGMPAAAQPRPQTSATSMPAVRKPAMPQDSSTGMPAARKPTMPQDSSTGMPAARKPTMPQDSSTGMPAAQKPVEPSSPQPVRNVDRGTIKPSGPPMPASSNKPIRLATPEETERKKAWEQHKSEGENAFSQGNIQLAEQAWTKALELAGQGDKKNPTYCYSLESLAEVYLRQNRYDDAEKLFRESHEIKVTVLGKNHVAVATVSTCLARLFVTSQDFDNALPFAKEAVDVYENVLGNRSVEFASSIHNLATLFHLRQEYHHAENCYVKALEIKKTLLGPQHAETTKLMKSYASLLKDTNREHEAAQVIDYAVGKISGKFRAVKFMNNEKPQSGWWKEELFGD